MQEDVRPILPFLTVVTQPVLEGFPRSCAKFFTEWNISQQEFFLTLAQFVYILSTVK